MPISTREQPSAIGLKIASRYLDGGPGFRLAHEITNAISEDRAASQASSTFTVADIRNLLGVLNFIEWEELNDALSRKVSRLDWDRFPSNFPALFRQADDAGRSSLVALINRKLEKGPAHV